ncbi:hypothetical protein ACFQAT_25740 [Undibacterium arcticum]|uniref:hypothetical protein n=1 Tax=Undibacterium arcticum TaxID=1762892 RepID=UPI0036211E58
MNNLPLLTASTGPCQVRSLETASHLLRALLVGCLLLGFSLAAHALTWKPLCTDGGSGQGAHNGTWHPLNTSSTGGGTWKPLGACTQPLTASANGDNFGCTGNTTGVQYYCYTYPTVIASGGTGGYTYSWTITAGANFGLANGTTAGPTVNHLVVKAGYTGTAVLSVTVTDNTGHQVTVTNIQCIYTA